MNIGLNTQRGRKRERLARTESGHTNVYTKSWMDADVETDVWRRRHRQTDIHTEGQTERREARAAMAEHESIAAGNAAECIQSSIRK